MINQISFQQNAFVRKFHNDMNYRNFEVNIFENHQSL
jgi:hypothetical protein